MITAPNPRSFVDGPPPAHVEGDIRRLYGVGERPHGDQIHPRLGHLPDPFQGHVSRRLAGDPPPDPADRRGHLRKAHVVEQDRIRAGGQRLIQLGQILHLDLDLQGVGNPLADPPDGRADPAGRRDVVVLDQDPVVEGEAVVEPAAHADGVLVEDPEPGSRLPGVEDFHRQPGDPIDIAPGRCGDSRHPLEEVQGDPFGGQDRGEPAGQLREEVPRIHPLAVAPQGLEDQGGIQGAKDLPEQFDPGHDHPCLGRRPGEARLIATQRRFFFCLRGLVQRIAAQNRALIRRSAGSRMRLPFQGC